MAGLQILKVAASVDTEEAVADIRQGVVSSFGIGQVADSSSPSDSSMLRDHIQGLPF